MKLKQQIIMFLLVFALASVFINLFSQPVKPKPSRQSSFEAYSKGNYEEAYNEFSELLQNYSRDPSYNYYSGVCLIKLNRDPDKAESLLKQALQTGSGLKTLPSDGYFYLGRAQQLSGKFEEAIGSYNLFTKKVGKKVSKESGVPDFIKQCNEKSGELTQSDVRQPETVGNIKVDSSTKAIKPVEKEVIIQPVEKEVISQPVAKEVSQAPALPLSYEKLQDQALELQFFADSLNSLVVRQKKELANLQENEKEAFRVKISENEKAAINYQKLADQKFSEASAVLNPVRGRIEKPDSIQHKEIKAISDSAARSVKEITRKPVIKEDTVRKIMPVETKTVSMFQLFEVLPKPVTNPNAKILIDPEVPAGLIYRIQMGVFRNPVAPVYFKGINPVYGFRIPGTDKTSYYAGMFRKSADANKALDIIKSRGFNDAFIVALFESKRISQERATVMEKEWSKKPFVTLEKPDQRFQKDTIPPTLSFKVEVIKSQKALKEDAVEGIRKIAGNRFFDVQTFDDGNIAYLIGKFITFDSAAEYCNLLIRNGYSEARVVAFLGEKEIPIDTAKHFFDKLK